MDRKQKNLIIQAGFVGGLVLILASFVLTARHNLVEQGIAAGFGFLERGTGWDMGFAFLPVSISDPYWWTLLMGLMNTVVVGYVAMVLATFLGVGLAAMRISGNPVLDRVALIYVDLIRNIPPILQVLAWYALFSSFPAPKQAIALGDTVFLSARGLYFPALNITGGAMAGCALAVVLLCAALLWIGLGQRFTFTPAARKWRMAAVALLAAGAAILLLVVLAGCPTRRCGRCRNSRGSTSVAA